MLVLNLEVVEGRDYSPVTNRICFCIYKDNEEYKSINVSMPIELEDLLLKLREYQDYWDICDLTIQQTGVYEFDYSYKGVKRLAGEFLFVSMFRFDNHLEEFERRIQSFQD